MLSTEFTMLKPDTLFVVLLKYLVLTLMWISGLPFEM